MGGGNQTPLSAVTDSKHCVFLCITEWPVYLLHWNIFQHLFYLNYKSDIILLQGVLFINEERVSSALSCNTSEHFG